MKEVFANAKVVPHDIPAYQYIEKVGRNAYKSEARITPDSALGFIKGLVDRTHWAVLEHEYMYAILDRDDVNVAKSCFSKEKYLNCYDRFISGSFRAWHEAFENADAKHDTTGKSVMMHLYEQAAKKYPEVFYSEKCEEYYADDYGTNAHFVTADEFKDAVTKEYGTAFLSKFMPITALITCDRGITHELVRHRPCAFLQESTRYCSYNKKAADDDIAEITVITPCYLTSKKNPNLPENVPEKIMANIKGDLKGKARKYCYETWASAQTVSELAYMSIMSMKNKGAKPQEARSVLTTSVKSDIYITATGEEWQHMVNMRYHGTSGKPHPQMLEVMSILYPQLVEASEGAIH